MQFAKFFEQMSSWQSIKRALVEQKQTLWLGLEASAKSYTIAALRRVASEQKVMLLTANLTKANDYVTELETFLPNEDIKLFQAPETVAEDMAVASPEALAERLDTMNWLLDERAHGVAVVPLFGARLPLLPITSWQDAELHLALEQEWTPDDLVRQLNTLGYHREDMVLKPGEMSVRGDIIDVYPLNREWPVRVSLAFDEVERISEYDPSTQKSTSPLEALTLIPADDFIITAEQRQAHAGKLKKVLTDAIAGVKDEAVKDELTTKIAEIVDLWQHGETEDSPRRYRALMQPESTTILDYLGADNILVIDDYPRLLEAEKTMDESVAAYRFSLIEQGQLPLPEQPYVPLAKLLKKDYGRRLYFAKWQRGYNHLSFDQVIQLQTRNITPFYDQSEALKVELTAWQRVGREIMIVLSDDTQRQRTKQMLDDVDLEAVETTLDEFIPGKINLVIGELANGVEFVDQNLVMIAEKEIFHHAKPRRRRQSLNISNAERMMSYQELKPGDYVVHVNHGIGKYLGVETLTVNGVHKDYMTIVFADDASIHVPTDQLDLVMKYVSADGKAPSLNRMGGTSWAKTKQRVQHQIEDIADDLIDLYAERESQNGYAYSADTPEQLEFEQAFPYAETPDQLQSIAEIKRDMESKKPMDRLLVGDVGFGKTEVAMRAAFKAMMDGKQVAFLVPTTILAEQHYETFQKRFYDYPFEIALLNRFRTSAEQKQTIQGLKDGSVQLVIGTHRLLSEDIQFLDLGLVVVDEEQRFGVQAKERLKTLKQTVDVLTLTATPIPRTLNMSMTGIRDLSVIETPPANRYPVQTYVIEQNEGAVRDAIQREMARGGQVFYLFNNVARIEEKAHLIETLVPDSRVAIAHGQMTAVQLENVMRAFLEGEYDVLVTTTIIETGVDMPNVNTLIVEDANRMGLSTLYQLRGRVGRSSRVAYAYFMFRADKAMNESGEKRLTALRDFTALGSGFKIAMRDLSIRGAGNLLGAEQHGFVNSVGYDLYMQMLREAVAKKQGHHTEKPKDPTEINLNIDAYLPSEYIPDENQKIEFYNRIIKLQTDDERWALDDEMLDRFGEPPQPVQWLLAVGLMRNVATQCQIKSIVKVRQQIELKTWPTDQPEKVTSGVFEAIGDLPFKLQMHSEDKCLVISLGTGKLTTDRWLDALLQFLMQLENILNVHEEGEKE
ncbi:MAG: transcription-repair coupling factor [Aerococcus sp.]|nr:transcription-repair coupling factor [Aerococcus sp.]